MILVLHKTQVLQNQVHAGTLFSSTHLRPPVAAIDTPLLTPPVTGEAYRVVLSLRRTLLESLYVQRAASSGVTLSLFVGGFGFSFVCVFRVDSVMGFEDYVNRD
ncbi:hypothetical protein Dsin_018731 [Dipteronia sinensis]|uniref:Transmembrane protein n=1 Tax=Dipteronia sinensis TaxID=43782 RepID=A0AAE0E233_9ROSI|nr:hypothetical protein Dsin_018731 [Dipteronia sinensis]